MARQKYDFGIDLGTTNSAIAVMDNGNIKIIKSHKYQKDTTPSKLTYRKKAIRVGDDAGDDECLSEFKRTMGTDKTYQTQYMTEPCSSEQLSAEILKQLKGYVTEENIQAAVITVPNQFHQNQIDATQRAAELAGFQCCELLQEPIAASMAFGIETSSMEGFWLVFDFGGGTFDTALMKVDEGIMKVVDTDGDNHLGGKDLDSAIIESILIPMLKEEYSVDQLLADEKKSQKIRGVLKKAAESLKISLSSKSEEFYDAAAGCDDDEGEEIEIEVTVTLAEYERVVTPIFQKAIDIAKELLSRNKVSDELLGSVLLVGGPTLSQTLRRMLKEQFTCKIDTSIDPMTSVARGAALFASTKTIPEGLQQRDYQKLQLKLKYPETTVEIEENLGVMLDREKCGDAIPKDLHLEVTRGDGGWSSGKVKFEEAEIVEVMLEAGKANVFKITVTDGKGIQVESEPSSITMIQGMKAAKATLPHSICIDSIIAESGKQRLVALEGLEKNNTLPAKGKGMFKTQKVLRPGNPEDVLIIPIIEGEPGERSQLNVTAAVINCSGDELAALLPQGSDVELSVMIDESRRITLSAYFPFIDESFDVDVVKNLDSQQKEVDSDAILVEINKARQSIAFSNNEAADELTAQLNELAERLQSALSNYDSKSKALSDLNVILKKVDLIQEAAEWPAVEEQLTEALNSVDKTNKQYGNKETQGIADQMRQHSLAVIKQKDHKLALDLIDQLNSFNFSMIREETGLWIGYIKGFDDDFDTQQWSNESEARQLINQAKEIIANSPSREKIERIVFALFALLPGKEQPMSSDGNSDLLLK